MSNTRLRDVFPNLLQNLDSADQALLPPGLAYIPTPVNYISTVDYSDFSPALHSTHLDLVVGDALHTANSTIPDVAVLSAEPLCFFKGQKGGRNVSQSGYAYTFDRHKEFTNQDYWQCLKRRRVQPNCTSRLFTSADNFVRLTPHNHEPDFDHVIKLHTLSKVKHGISSTDKPASHIRRQLLAVPESVKTNLPSMTNMKKAVRRNRAKHIPVVPNVQNTNDFDIPDEFKLDGCNNRFLLSDMTVQQKRILIFSTDSCLDALQHPRAVGPTFIDGTFATAPQGFVQNWIIRGSLHNDEMGTMASLSAYALIQNKTAISYFNVLEQMKVAAPLWTPTSFVCDFELACTEWGGITSPMT